MEKALDTLCRDHLPHVSRTFALTIPVLREPMRGAVGLAYLICRLVDTVEDHPSLTQSERDLWLTYWEAALQGRPPAQRPRWKTVPDSRLQDLFEAGPRLLKAREDLPPGAGQAVDHCVLEMTRGMRTFPGRGSQSVLACPNLDELERYCHVVAGTVGQLLTKLFALRLGATWASPDQLELGRRFGLGLQLVNILKDRRGDQARGVSYCPPLDPRTSAGLPQPVVLLALDHLKSGQRFMEAIPREHEDLLSFCVIPHRLALATLRQLLQGESKIPRAEIPALLASCRQAVLDPTHDRSTALELFDEVKALATVSSAPTPAPSQP